ncbi:hypothetical protein VTH06DRAFT_2653 [Thermothelomyces fergusii]
MEEIPLQEPFWVGKWMMLIEQREQGYEVLVTLMHVSTLFKREQHLTELVSSLDQVELVGRIREQEFFATSADSAEHGVLKVEDI